VATALEAEPTFAGRLERLAAELGCGIEAVDAEGQPIVAGAPPRDGFTLPLSAGGRGFGSLVLPADTDRALAAAVVARAAASLDAARLLESEQRARLRTEVLQGVTSALSGAATPEEVGHAVAEQGARALGGTGGVVYALAPGEQTLRVIGSWGYDPDAVDAYRAVEMTTKLPVVDVTRDRESICIQSQTELLAHYPMLVDRVVGSLCAVPLLAGDDVLGAVGVSRSDSRGFYPAERELLEALGRQGGQALERARLYRRQQLANDRLYRLQETTRPPRRAATPSAPTAPGSRCSTNTDARSSSPMRPAMRRPRCSASSHCRSMRSSRWPRPHARPRRCGWRARTRSSARIRAFARCARRRSRRRCFRSPTAASRSARSGSCSTARGRSGRTTAITC
jgi:hypothetical protein